MGKHFWSEMPLSPGLSNRLRDALAEDGSLLLLEGPPGIGKTSLVLAAGGRGRDYRPRTNGKAERFIRTLLAGWAYGATYSSSAERTAALDGWLWTYNHRRPHGALSHKPPIARPNEVNNPAGSYT